MDITAITNIVLPFASVLVILALIWFVIELVLMVRRARTAVKDVHKRLVPTLEHVEHITAALEPVAGKVDPLMERVALTVDAANLEIMRLDQILEDVNEITGTISSAANAVDAAANAPIELVSNVTSRVRNAFKPRRASSESIALGERKAQEDGREGLAPNEGPFPETQPETAQGQNQGSGQGPAAAAAAAGSVGAAAAIGAVSPTVYEGSRGAATAAQPASAAGAEGQYFTYSQADAARQNEPVTGRSTQPFSASADEDAALVEARAANRKAVQEAQAAQAAARAAAREAAAGQPDEGV